MKAQTASLTRNHLEALTTLHNTRKKFSTQFCSITFVKKDGSKSKIVGWLVDSPKSHSNNFELLTVKRVNPKEKGKFASFSIHNVLQVKASNRTYNFNLKEAA